MNHSPNPTKKQQEMTFPAALAELIKGKRITKLEWKDKDKYGSLENGFLSYHDQRGFHQWLVSDGDLLGVDWIVLEKVN